jgi:hypothetical protein
MELPPENQNIPSFWMNKSDFLHPNLQRSQFHPGNYIIGLETGQQF